MWQIGKQILTLTKSYAVYFLLLCGLAFAGSAWGQEKSVVTDSLRGVAISGYDPVAYFTEDAAVLGTSLYDYEWNGAVWYFASAANRDVFIANPDIYAPLFGGHCAMAVARGYLARSNPQIFRVAGGRLMLFYSIGNRAAFDLAPASALADAFEHWDSLPDRRVPEPQ